MATTRSKLPSLGIGGGSITKTLMKSASALKGTAIRIHRAITGGPREQTYGNIADLWPSKPKNRKDRTSYVDRSTSTATAIPPMPGMDTQEILDLMKRNYEQEKRYREVQKSFAEERANEEQERHEELIKALKKVTGGTATPIAEAKKEDGGIMEFLKNIIESLKEKFDALTKKVDEWITKFAEMELLKKPLDWLKTALSGLFTAPFLLATGIAAAMGAALIGLQLFELRNLEALGGEEAARLGGERQTEEMLGAMDSGAFGSAIMNANEETKGEKIQKLIRIKQETMAGLLEPEGYTVSGVNKEGRFLFENKKGNPPPKELYDMVSAQANLMMRQGKSLTPNNLDSILNINEHDVPQPKPLTDIYQSDIKTDEELSKPAFGVRPMGIKPVPVPPEPSPVAQLTDMNLDLERYNINPMGDVGGLLIQQNDLGTTKVDGPMPMSAPPRDEEPMAAIIFRTQRRKARAY